MARLMSRSEARKLGLSRCAVGWGEGAASPRLESCVSVNVMGDVVMLDRGEGVYAPPGEAQGGGLVRQVRAVNQTMRALDGCLSGQCVRSEVGRHGWCCWPEKVAVGGLILVRGLEPPPCEVGASEPSLTRLGYGGYQVSEATKPANFTLSDTLNGNSGSLASLIIGFDLYAALMHCNHACRVGLRRDALLVVVDRAFKMLNVTIVTHPQAGTDVLQHCHVWGFVSKRLKAAGRSRLNIP
jgi:hypothetical protein